MGSDILIVDDEQDICDLVSGLLSDEGYSPRYAKDGETALASIKTRQPNLVILDVWLGENDRDGLKILSVIQRDHPYVPVIMISGHSTIETAVQAIKQGAYDFLQKPFDSNRLLLSVERALEAARLRRENQELKTKSTSEGPLVGESPAILHIRQQIHKAAPTNSRILIQGPSGAGKEIVARHIHQKSQRSSGPFVVLNCASLHPDRLDIELFGTEIAYHDPLIPRKIGLLEEAHGGILLLDEILDLPLPTQGKLIRVLQDQSFCRLGGSQKVEVDVRIMATTSRDIPQALAEGHFREDLYYRLNVVPIKMPPLQERVADIPDLLHFFMHQISSAHGRLPRPFAEDSLILMQSYSWPGNVRQLRNVIEWILIMAPGSGKDPITPSMLPPEIRQETTLISSTKGVSSSTVVVMPLREAREVFEREYLMAQVNRFGGNISKTARFIGMERSALHRKLRALGLYEERELPPELEKPCETEMKIA